MDCPFCEDVKIQERLIYRDELIMAFPTNIPIVPGHTLICPVRHVAILDELNSDELKAIKDFIITLKGALKTSFKAEGFNMALNEGSVAGQSVEHFHLHILPRTEGDAGVHEYEPRKFLYRPGSREESPDKELINVAQLIKQNIL